MSSAGPPPAPPQIAGPELPSRPPAASDNVAPLAPTTGFETSAIGFTPLRTDPPPRLFATWWLRYLLFLAQLVALVVVLMREYASGPGQVATSPGVVVSYALVAVLLVSWSALAMVDAARLVPATRYQPKSRWWLAVALWLVAFAAPVAAVATVAWARDRFAADAEDVGPVVITVAVVLVSFLLVWLPFQYHTRQAQRIGAPLRIVAGWFWIPLAAGVGTLAIDALGLHELLAEDGFSRWDRTVQVAVVFGLPALMLALSTWRATTVFDEVIELRWLRWRTEWNQTLAAMAAQPPPGPEMAPPTREA